MYWHFLGDLGVMLCTPLSSVPGLPCTDDDLALRVYGSSSGSARGKTSAALDAALHKLWDTVEEESGPEHAVYILAKLVARSYIDRPPENRSTDWLLARFKEYPDAVREALTREQ